MTQQTQTLYDENGDPVEVPIQAPAEEHTPQEWAALRQEKKARKDAEERAAILERKDAIREAGIDTKSPLGKFFADKYDGEATVEAVTAAAIAAGFVETPDTAPAPAADPAVVAGQEAGERIAAASPGAGTVAALPASSTLDDAFLAGGTEGLLAAAREAGLTVVDSQ